MPASIFAGSKVKTLKDILTLNDKTDIISSTVDPTSSAVSAPIGSLLINQTSGKLYKKLDAGSSTNWQEVGAGVGGINYIKNPDAEVNTTGWATYADAAGTSPVDGTGGSPTVTWTSSATTPLRGTKSFVLTKDAANRQGEGVAYAFTIDDADKAKVLSISFDYEVGSGTYASGDTTVWIYDVTNAQVIQPAPSSILNTTVEGRWAGTFQSASNSTSYRLILHVSSTSASAYTLRVDNVQVGPQSIAYGAPVTDWQSYTPTGSWVSNTTYTGRWRRVGDTMQIQALVSLSGAPSGTFSVNLPSGYTMDTNKITSTVVGAGSFGQAHANDTGVNNYVGDVVYASTTSVNVVGSSGSAALWSSTVPFSFNNADSVQLEFSLPISGWSSSTVVSSEADTRVVAAGARLITTNQVITAGSPATVIFNTVRFDTHASYNSSTGVYTAPVAGRYVCKAVILASTGTAPSSHGFYFLVNNTGDKFGYFQQAAITGGTNNTYHSEATITLNAGDNVRVVFFSNTQNTTLIANATDDATALYIERLSGPAQIAASESVTASYTNSSTTVNGATDTTLVFATKDYDSHGGMNTGTGIYTVPVSGKYRVSCNFTASGGSGAGSANNLTTIRMQKSGSSSVQRIMGSFTASSTAAIQRSLSGSTTVNCLAGDTIYVFINNPDSAFVGANTANGTWLTIERVGNY